MLWAFFLLFFNSWSFAIVDQDRVDTLPGWNGLLPSPQFSGFIEAGTPPSGSGKMMMHYWLIESERDSANDPILLW
jgi:cathepsin A (carboxypeptidase C)/serine carboxypeptidase-like clade 1